MAAASTADRLGEWLSEAYGVLTEVQSIVSDTSTPTAGTGADATSGANSGSPPYSQATAGSATTPTASPTSALSSTSQWSSSTPSPTSETYSATQSSPIASISQPSSISSSKSAHTTKSASSTSNPAQPSITSASSASSVAAAAHPKHHNQSIVPIVLGTVFGIIGLILLALLLLWYLRRRRSRRERRIVSPDDDEIASWRGLDRASQQPMMSEITAPERSSYNNGYPPPITQHPAYRGIETGSTNPFVPPVPAPRRSVPNGNSGPADSAVNRDFTPTSTTTQTRDEPLPTGVAELASGVAVHKIPRKPVNTQASAEAESRLSGTTSPVERSNGYFGYGYGTSSERNVPPPSSARPAYGHARSPSNQPLMSEMRDNGQPPSYTPERPPTPHGLMGFGKAATGGAVGAIAAGGFNNHNEKHHSSTSSSSPSPPRESYESFTMRPAPSHLPAQHQAPPITRSPRRVSFNTPIETPPSPASYRRDSSGTGSRNGSPSAIGYSDYAYPLPTTHKASTPSSSSRTGSDESTYRLHSGRPGFPSSSSSSSSPNRGGYHTHASSQTSYPSPGLFGVQPKPAGKRLRLSDIRAAEEELERLREHEGWEDQEIHGDESHNVGRAM